MTESSPTGNNNFRAWYAEHSTEFSHFNLFMARYFRFFAKFSLRRWKPRIFVVTGSAGKTMMLHLLEHELGQSAHYSHDANSAIGISLDILGLKGIKNSKLRWLSIIFAAPLRALTFSHKEKYYVAEIDGSRPGETEFLASWLKPEVTFWVSLGLSHAAQFDQVVKKGKYASLEAAIAHEFAALPKNTQKLVYICADEPDMAEAVKDIKAKVKSFRKNDIRKYSIRPSSTDFTHGDNLFHFNSPQPHELSIQLLMLEDFIQNYLHLKLKTDFSKMELPPGRSSYFEGIKDTNIIDSSYNAHLISMASILDMARRMQAEHKWLIIGDIVDQGSVEGEEHKKLAGLIADVEPECVILIGRRVKKYTAPRLKQFGVSAITTTDPKKALRYIKEHLKGGETLIFKGSQYLEWIIEKLLKNPEDADKLCRRDAGSRHRRESWGLDS